MQAVNSGAAVRLEEDEREIVLDGPPYLDVLARLHDKLRPRTYFEVGTWHGDSLRLAQCASLAVDPQFQLEEGVIGSKPVCIFHQATSDDFFASNDPTAILGGPIEFAFIDGFHNFDFVLREFIATERSCERESIIAIDDCAPRDFFMARHTLVPERQQPTKYPGFWTGDVWKIVPVLREYRPDIQCVLLDTQPTGLAICSNLNPNDHTLTAKYDEILERWRDVRLEDYGMKRLLGDLRFEASDPWVAARKSLHPEDAEPRSRTGPAGPGLKEEIHALRGELDALRTSTSWRLTRPLRAISSVARRLLGG